MPNEPPLPENDSAAARKRAIKDVNWYDAKDLETIKAWSNKIVELQPELSLFGSLKTLDVRLYAVPFVADSLINFRDEAQQQFAHVLTGVDLRPFCFDVHRSITQFAGVITR